MTPARLARVPVVAVLVAMAVLVAISPAAAQTAMPDPRQMAGIPRPVDDLPDRSISVRLIRGQLSNNITGHPVELHLGSLRGVVTVNTDDTGRAQFDNVEPGGEVRAVAVVEGERLESQVFAPPARGGIRLLLVATDRTAAPSGRPAPVRAGDVVFADSSRILIETGDDGLRIFYLFDLQNASATAVDGKGPILIDVPPDAQGLTLLAESSPQASAGGSRITVTGPFQPGSTAVHAAFQLRVTGGSVNISQALPARTSAFAVIVQKTAGLELMSSQLTDRREMTTPDGAPFIIARGPSLAAGEPIAFGLTGLPHHSRWPVRIALGLAGMVVVLGVWFGGFREQSGDRARRESLLARREQLLDRLAALERDRRNSLVDADRFGARRGELVRSLERVYGELDSRAGPVVRDEGPPR